MATLQSEYLYNGVHRLSYGWQNPNFAAAVLVCLLPLCWVLTDSQTLKPGLGTYLSWTAEILVGVMLVWTFSRGAVLAWALGVVLYGLILPRLFRQVSGVPIPRQHFWLRLIILGIAVSSNGLFHRFAGVADGDASAWHRTEIWMGGLAMLRYAPLTGWGAGNSGLAFMQWFQNPASTFGIGSMVNSYLWLAVERGLPALFVALMTFGVPSSLALLAAEVPAGRRRLVLHGTSAGLCCFMVASCFSTLWGAWSVLWAPVAVGLLLVLAILGQTSLATLRRACFFSAFGSAAVCGLLFVLSSCLSRSGAWIFQPPFQQAAAFVRRAPSNGANLVFLPDYRLLGPYYGRVLRGAAEDNHSGILSFQVIPPDQAVPVPLGGTILAFGSRYQNLIAPTAGAKVFLVCPSGDPVELSPGLKPSLLLLPAHDEIGYEALWRAWAQKTGCPIQMLANSGQDIASAISPLLGAILMKP